MFDLGFHKVFLIFIFGNVCFIIISQLWRRHLSTKAIEIFLNQSLIGFRNILLLLHTLTVVTGTCIKTTGMNTNTAAATEKTDVRATMTSGTTRATTTGEWSGVVYCRLSVACHCLNVVSILCFRESI